MTRLLITAAALSALAMAAPAGAQVLGGGVQGGVGGQVGVPNVGPAVGQTVTGAGTVARDTLGDAREAARESRPTAGAAVDMQASAGASADRSNAAADFDVSSGAMVHASDGAMLGNVVRVTRNAAGRAEGFIVRSADGATRYVPAAGARVEGDAVVTGWSRSEFDAAARQEQ